MICNENEYLSVYGIEPKGQNEKILDVFLQFLSLYVSINAIYMNKIFSMSIHTPKKGIEWMTENLVYEAKTLLEQQDDAINRQIDTGTGTYFSVCISFLKKEYPNFREEQIKDLYEACMKKPSPSETKIQAVRENTPTNIGKILQEEDIYLQLVDQLSFSYKEFCVKNNLKEGDPIPEKMQQIIVFEYL